MADQDEWSSNANEAIHISIVQAQPGSETPKTLSTFRPQFTYPIFGDEERIFGYKGLRINVRFAAHDLYPNVEVLYDKKFKAIGETKATDIEATLKDWIPEVAFDKVGTFNDHVQNDPSATTFTPPGELLETYTSGQRTFEIWTGELTDINVQRLIERMQIFISFFIEGGTPLQLDDQDWTLAQWRVFFLYERHIINPRTFSITRSIVGYSTSYRFIKCFGNEPFKAEPPTHIWEPFEVEPQAKKKESSKAKQQAQTNEYSEYEPQTRTLPLTFTLPLTEPLTPMALPARERISQFLILPPHHSYGHGTQLYNAMVGVYLRSPSCVEITVEDPNEAFDDLRDYCDYIRLLENGTLDKLSIGDDLVPTVFDKRLGARVPTGRLLNLPFVNTMRIQNKIAPRQFARIIELHLLSHIAPWARQAGTRRITRRAESSHRHDRAFYYWRLLVKQRIYKKNKDVLIQLDRLERIDKVEQAVGEQAGDYERLLRGLLRSEGSAKSGKFLVTREKGKRKVVTKNGKVLYQDEKAAEAAEEVSGDVDVKADVELGGKEEESDEPPVKRKAKRLKT